MARRPASPHVLAVARGERPADLLLTGGRVLAPATRDWVATDLAIADGVVAGWGRREAAEVVDVAGAALTAGFVDAHMHLESTKLWVDELVRTVLPLGTTAVAADPHELANVFGVSGVAARPPGARPLPVPLRALPPRRVPPPPLGGPRGRPDLPAVPRPPAAPRAGAGGPPPARERPPTESRAPARAARPGEGPRIPAPGTG